MERAVVMTGLGGQGLQLAAKLLAEAAIREGRHVMMFGIFEGMIRGGSSRSTVVVGDEEIVAPPIVPSVWGVVALHGGGLAALAGKMEPGGVLVRNADVIAAAPGWPGVRDVPIAAGELAKAAGQSLGAAMVALGAFAAVTGIVRVASLVEALEHVLPPHRRKHAAGNRVCLERGAAAVGGAPTPAWTAPPAVAP